MRHQHIRAIRPSPQENNTAGVYIACVMRLAGLSVCLSVCLSICTTVARKQEKKYKRMVWTFSRAGVTRALILQFKRLKVKITGRHKLQDND